MLTKNTVLQSIDNLSDSFTIDELIEKIINEFQIDILRVYHSGRMLTSS
jgi:poly(3-hydroxybutyrate) depolymerase